MVTQVGVWVVVGACLLAACGGHTTYRLPDDAEGGSSGSGGKGRAQGSTSGASSSQGGSAATGGSGVASDGCASGRSSYFDFRKQLLEKYQGAGCQTDLDCGRLFEGNACVSGCGGEPLPATLVDDASSNLAQYAREVCASCPPSPIPPCEPPAPVACVMNRCAVVAF